MTRHKKDEAKTPLTPSTAFLDVLRQHLAIFTEHYRQPISELSVVAYAEDLACLTADQLDAACREARRTSEFMPVSAAILAAHESLSARQYQFAGPRLEWNPELEKERIERKIAWERQLQEGQNGDAPQNPQQHNRQRTAHVSKSIEEQKEDLRKRGFLQ